MKQDKDAFFDFGKRIRWLRMEHNLSQEALALNAGITPAYLGMVERGEKNPTLLTVEKLCGALGISLEECFAQESASLEPDLITRQVLSHLRSMDEREKEVVLRVVEQLCRMQELASEKE